MTTESNASSYLTARPSVGRWFETHDGARIFFRHLPALSPTPRGAILLFHRGHEHSGRMAHLVDELSLPDFAYYAWDARGHGCSREGRAAAETPPMNFSDSVRDVECFVRFIAREDNVPIENMAAVAQSVGAALVAAWAHDYAPGCAPWFSLHPPSTLSSMFPLREHFYGIMAQTPQR